MRDFTGLPVAFQDRRDELSKDAENILNYIDDLQDRIIALEYVRHQFGSSIYWLIRLFSLVDGTIPTFTIPGSIVREYEQNAPDGMNYLNVFALMNRDPLTDDVTVKFELKPL